MNAASLQESTSETGRARNARQYERFAVDLKATMVVGKKTVEGGVVDISFNGLFFTTEEPPQLRNLIKINVKLPSGKSAPLLGMAVHVVQADAKSKRRPGVGVQLFGIAPDVRLLWDAYVTSVRDTYADAKENGTAPNPSIVGNVEYPNPSAPAATPAAESKPSKKASAKASPHPVGPPLDLPTLTSQDVLDAFDRIELPGESKEASRAEPEPSAGGPGDVAPGPAPAKAKPELRIRVRSQEDVAIVRERRARGESLFFRTEVHLEPGAQVVVRVILPNDDTALIADGKVLSRSDSSTAKGLSVQLEKHDGTFEEIYITIDLETSIS